MGLSGVAKNLPGSVAMAACLLVTAGSARAQKRVPLHLAVVAFQAGIVGNDNPSLLRGVEAPPDLTRAYWYFTRALSSTGRLAVANPAFLASLASFRRLPAQTIWVSSPQGLPAVIFDPRWSTAVAKEAGADALVVVLIGPSIQSTAMPVGLGFWGQPLAVPYNGHAGVRLDVQAYDARGRRLWNDRVERIGESFQASAPSIDVPMQFLAQLLDAAADEAGRRLAAGLRPGP